MTTRIAYTITGMYRSRICKKTTLLYEIIRNAHKEVINQEIIPGPCSFVSKLQTAGHEGTTFSLGSVSFDCGISFLVFSVEHAQGIISTRQLKI